MLRFNDAVDFLNLDKDSLIIRITGDNVVPDGSFYFYFVTIITLVTGTIFIMWLGEQISDHGLGNGISLIIMCGIISMLPFVFQSEWFNIKDNPYRYFFLAILMFCITLVVQNLHNFQKGKLKI